MLDGNARLACTVTLSDLTKEKSSNEMSDLYVSDNEDVTSHRVTGLIDITDALKKELKLNELSIPDVQVHKEYCYSNLICYYFLSFFL